MTAGIYLIINKINGHMYIGGSVNIKNRLNQHKVGSDSDTQAIDRAILKYGREKFIYKIIEELPADWDIIGEREKYWISFYNTFENKNHYNLKPGGEKDYNLSDETRQKISKNHADVSGKKNPAYRHDIPSAQELLEEYEKGNIKQKDMAKKYNCSIVLIERRLRKARKEKYGDKGHPSLYAHIPSPKELLHEYNLGNTTYKELSEKYNCSPSTIHKRIKKVRDD